MVLATSVQLKTQVAGLHEETEVRDALAHCGKAAIKEACPMLRMDIKAQDAGLHRRARLGRIFSLTRHGQHRGAA
jgi:hypothetical protein